MQRVMVYSNDNCAYCRYAKRLLDGRGIAYEEIELATDDAGRARLAALTGRLSFPQIVVDGEPIGGFAELAQLIRDGRLSPAPDDGVERAA